ncbi:MAG: hypothetical protein JO076_17340 [Verrucomicrobia bacterium]|nr:hypothetical protein [Verrucomicrobiota bacterium]
MPESLNLQAVLNELKLPRLSPTNPALMPGLVSDIESSFDETTSADPRQLALKSLLLLQAGELEKAHAIVQSMTTPQAAYVHGIIHRVEGDFGNARYWFHRAGALNSELKGEHLTTQFERQSQNPNPDLVADLNQEFFALVRHLQEPK